MSSVDSLDTISGRVLAALVASGTITAEEMDMARENALRKSCRPDEVLRSRGLLRPKDVENVLETEMGMPHLDLASYAPEAEALQMLPGTAARDIGIIPLFDIEGIVTVAIGDPLDVFRLDVLAEQLDLKLEPVLADPKAIEAALDTYYDRDGGLIGAELGGAVGAAGTFAQADADLLGDEATSDASGSDPTATALAGDETPDADAREPDPPEERSPAARIAAAAAARVGGSLAGMSDDEDFEFDEDEDEDDGQLELDAITEPALAAEPTTASTSPPGARIPPSGEGPDVAAWPPPETAARREEIPVLDIPTADAKARVTPETAQIAGDGPALEPAEPIADTSDSEAEAAVEDGGAPAFEPPTTMEAPMAPTPTPAPEPVDAGAEQAFVVTEAASPSALPTMSTPAEPQEADALVDLDVLAVADARAVSVLVNHILERAVERGADWIHVLPYKEDFFLVARIGRRLEKMGAAPRSLQRPLVEGFAALAGLPTSGAAPLTARLRRRVLDRDVILVMNLVTTMAGQRLVVGIEDAAVEPRPLDALGLTRMEARALEGLAERGRGLVVFASPAGEGRSVTYRALLAAASAAGRTVYSVERDPDVVLPAVAQVVADAAPGGSAEVCLRAGLLQDTDLLAVDDLQHGAELSPLLSAAARGKLTVASVRADSAAGAIERLLQLGADPTSLATWTTAVVAQRLARTVCPSCGMERHDPLADRVPELGPASVTRLGAGCRECGGTGLGERTGLFELLAVGPAVRSGLHTGQWHAAVDAALADVTSHTIADAALASVRDGRMGVSELLRITWSMGA